MKTIDLFCASPAATAICTGMDKRAMVRHGSRPIDRHGHQHLGNGRRRRHRNATVDDLIKPYSERSRNSNSSSNQIEQRRRSSADILDLAKNTPPRSSRYLLSDTPFIDFSSDSATVSALVPSQQPLISASSSNACRVLKSLSPSSSSVPSGDFPVFKSSSSTRSNDSPPVLKSSSSRSCPSDQVVELRVSIHCKGCEGKVRRHISRMEGVTSFSIDLATKKVTVVGDVTPLGVLTSISRVKNAQFWPSPASSSSLSSPIVGQIYY